MRITFVLILVGSFNETLKLRMVLPTPHLTIAFMSEARVILETTEFAVGVKSESGLGDS